MTSVASGTGSHPPGHWIYVDEGRTHEVHAQDVPSGRRRALVTTEFPFGSRDPNDALHLEVPYEEPWELKLQLAELEMRLALAGKYWKSDPAAGTWAPVASRPPPQPVHLAAHELPLPGDKSGKARMGFHHFHDARDAKDRFLVTMPRLDVPGGRFVLADLAFQFPQVDEGDLNILHTRLTPSLLQASIVREHLELPKRGYAKLVEARDYAKAYGDGWREAVRQTFSAATKRLLEGRTGAGRKPVRPQPQRMVLPVDIGRALRDPRVRAVSERHLARGEEEELVGGGELAIRRSVAMRRRKANHKDQHELSLLEAQLLVRYAMKAGRRALLKEAGGQLVRFVDGYG